jgi:hypothetical protein
MIQNHPLFIFGGAPQAHGELRGPRALAVPQTIERTPLRGYPLLRC